MYAAILDLNNRAHALDDITRHLSRRIESVAWEGAAAGAMRTQAGTALAELRRCAQLHNDAAAALERHRQAALSSPLVDFGHDVLHVARGVFDLGGLL